MQFCPKRDFSSLMHFTGKENIKNFLSVYSLWQIPYLSISVCVYVVSQVLIVLLEGLLGVISLQGGGKLQQ